MSAPNLGFKPRTRVEMLQSAYSTWKKQTGSTGTDIEFQATNVHKFCNIFFDEIETLESMVMELLVRQHNFWESTVSEINGAMGSSLEGWINRFVNTDLCLGLDIVTSDDARAKLKWPDVPKKLVPGEIVVYFDSLDDSDIGPLSVVHMAWIQCKNIAEPTKHGNDRVDKNDSSKKIDNVMRVYYSNGRYADYVYNNLISDDYTFIDIKATLTYETGGLQYPETKIIKLIEQRFAENITINKSLYVKALFASPDMRGLKDVKIVTKVTKGAGLTSKAADSDYVEGDREIELGNKFALGKIEVVQGYS